MGFLVGPLLSGSLVNVFGYYIMNSVFGMYISNPDHQRTLMWILASICVVLSVLALAFLQGKSSVRGQKQQRGESAPEV
jgi:uncharacterized membrane protein